jgi:hypothetical protein
MQGLHLRKYNAATTIDFELFEVDGVNLRVDAVHAAGDTQISKDEAAQANTGSGFVDRGDFYSIALTATEMQAARIVLRIVDQTATKVWLDKTIVIETYGNASAQHAFDLDTAIPDVNLAQINASVTAAQNLAKTADAISRGTCDTGGTTTSVPTSAFTPTGSGLDQFKGRIITFDDDTTTAALRAQATDITSSTNAATPTFTVSALSTAPVSGDTFSVT